MLKKLISNETTKLLKQTGYLVILIIVLAAFAISPIVSRLTFNITSSITQNQNMKEDYKREIEMAESAREYNMVTSYAYLMRAESIKFFIDNNLPEWKYKVYGDSYYNLYVVVRSYELVQMNELQLEDCYYLQTDDVLDLYNSTKEELASLVKTINEDTPEQYNLRSLETAKVYRDLYEKAYEEAKETYEKDKTKINQYALDKSLLQCKILENLVEATQLMYETNSEPYSWRSSAVTVAIDCVQSIERTYPNLEKEDFSPALSGYSTYEDYISYSNAKVQAYYEKASNYIFSAKNNIIVRDSQYTGAISNKEVLRSSYISIEGILWILFAVIGASMVAQEFSTGTTRLLLIRPVSRNKILSSKVFTLLITYLVITIGGFILQNIVLMIFYGVGDIFTSNVIFIFGKSVAVPSILSFLKLFVEKFVITALYSMYAILFASLIKKTFVCVLIIYGIKSGLSLLATVLNVIKNVVTLPYWLNFTPIVFLDGIGSNGNTVDSVLGILGDLFGYNVSPSFGYFHTWLGVMFYAIMLVVITILAYNSYRKAQVLN